MPRKRPLPLNMRLGNGVYCGIRVGGAGVGLKNHPHWAASYYCTRGLAVWTRLWSRTDGIDFAHRFWTVHVAPASGRDPHLHVRRVTHGWFVGTRH
jgi:hypothetical protein